MATWEVETDVNPVSRQIGTNTQEDPGNLDTVQDVRDYLASLDPAEIATPEQTDKNGNVMSQEKITMVAP